MATRPSSTTFLGEVRVSLTARSLLGAVALRCWRTATENKDEPQSAQRAEPQGFVCTDPANEALPCSSTGISLTLEPWAQNLESLRPVVLIKVNRKGNHLAPAAQAPSDFLTFIEARPTSRSEGQGKQAVNSPCY